MSAQSCAAIAIMLTGAAAVAQTPFTQPASGSMPAAPAEAARIAAQLAFSGLGMVVIAAASVLFWRFRSRTPFAWFLIGAAVWAVGVTLKFAWAIPLNKHIAHALQQNLPPDAFPLCLSLYVGLLTGVFEVAVTLVGALIWRQWAANAGRAVAIGVGAGALEALLIGLVNIAIAALVAANLSPEITAQTIQTHGATPVLWLTGPTERLIALLCHVSSRTLTLMAVTTRRWRLFWGGFAVLTLLDAVATYDVQVKMLEVHSVWLIYVTLAPFALVSIPITMWCIRHWPTIGAPAGPLPAPVPPARDNPI